MLKTTRLSDLAPRRLLIDEVVGDSSKADNKNLSKKSKNVKSEIQTYIGAIREPIFLTSGAKKAFNQLKQTFIKALILQHFNPVCHI